MTPEERLASLAKPPGSLGTLEEWAIVLCRVQKTLEPAATPASVLVFCADHGVKKADQALSPFPPSVTQAVFRSLCAGISGVAVLARAADAHLTVVDVGIDGEVGDASAATGRAISVRHDKVARGSHDLCAGPAMDEATLARALQAGRDAMAAEAAERGARVVALGEVGIGNTTSAAALLAALTGAASDADVAACCGRGTGLDDAGLAHKAEAVGRALSLHRGHVRAQGQLCEGLDAPPPCGRPADGLSGPSATDAAGGGSGGAGGDDAAAVGGGTAAVDAAAGTATDAADAADAARAREALRRLGGLELAALVGAFLEAEGRGVVAVVDGFICGVAALVAARLRPACRAHMLLATALAEEPSAPQGGARLAAALGVGGVGGSGGSANGGGGVVMAAPALSMGLRLGEGSGAALALPLVRAAAAVVSQMGTLAEAMALGGT